MALPATLKQNWRIGLRGEDGCSGFFFACIFAVALLCNARAEDKRVALVIGNSKYQNINSLKNPVNDASDMSAALSRLGFNVTTLTDGSANDIRKALTAFSEKSKAALISLVFYSGHAIETGGVTWFVPVDGKATRFPV